VLLGVSGAPAVMIAAGVLFLFVAYIATMSRLAERSELEMMAVPAHPDAAVGGRT
jgi:hypothetical protein